MTHGSPVDARRPDHRRPTSTRAPPAASPRRAVVASLYGGPACRGRHRRRPIHPFGTGGAAPAASPDNCHTTSLATVTRHALSSQTEVNATLGYAGSYTVMNQARGTITALPGRGQVVRQGQRLLPGERQARRAARRLDPRLPQPLRRIVASD